ncbi:MAG TPA: ABC transporter permease [Candidatus Marinimicrobia bacterium]|nr:ABC transporter permease [Candidatus Neomarinimicrobiota bacterium]
MRRIFENRMLFSILILVLFVIISAIIEPNYSDPRHIFTVVQQSAPLIVVTIGQIFVMLTGGIDLSVGSIVIFTDVFAASLIMGSDERTFFGIIAALLVGAIFGTINGLGVELIKLPPLVMTLASSIGIQGVMLLYCGGFPRGGASKILKFIGSGRWGIIPASICVWMIGLVVSYLILRKTKFGWTLYFLGANRQAARTIGIRCKPMGILAYTFSGLFAALAGVLILGYVGIPSLVLGDDYTMASIASAVLGGVSFSGGSGSVFGAFSGGLLMRFVLTLLTAFNISAAGKNIVQGVIIFAMVAFLTLQERKGEI